MLPYHQQMMLTAPLVPHRHLQRNPDNQLYPLFEYFENWCQVRTDSCAKLCIAAFGCGLCKPLACSENVLYGR